MTEIRDGTRITLDSATLRMLLNEDDVHDMKIILNQEIRRQEVPDFLKKDFNVPCDTVKPKMLYLCDRRKCEKCSPECTHTTDIGHAENFRVSLNGTYIEIGEVRK